MQSSDIRARFLEFFKNRGHAVIPSASLVTSGEKGVTNSTLFNTAGMQPLIPYLLGEPYLIDGVATKRLVNVQKCLRTVDIDDVGDKTHATFFEMLGNWSLGDYFKKEAINWSYEFLTNPTDAPEGDRGLGLDPNRLYVTVFEGDNNAPRDEEAAKIWRDIFKENKVNGADTDTLKDESGRIFFMPADKNWWEAGENGPCGPDSEMYYDVGDPKTGKPIWGGQPISKDRFLKADNERTIVEIWNDVFMQYEKKDGKIIGKLSKPSVDTGAGLERLAMIMQGVDNIFDTDLFKPLQDNLKTNKEVGNYSDKSARIILDHTRAATFLIADGVTPSNTGRGYVLRRLIRRAVDNAREINFTGDVIVISKLAKDLAIHYSGVYPNLIATDIEEILSVEVNGYVDTLRKGIQKIIYTPQLKNFNPEQQAEFIFDLYQSDGLPIAIAFKEISTRYGFMVSDGVKKIIIGLMGKHQKLSRVGAEQKFKGGLGDANDPKVVRYHTATHLLHQALHDVLGDSVMQKGSNITPERLRFDFSHGAKMTDKEKKRVEEIVNEKIAAAMPVNQITMDKDKAEKTGARHSFGDKYGDKVSIYFVGPDLQSAYSKEFCGGPHVNNTSELGHFKIVKEEAVAQGVRRIKAILE